MNSTIDKLALIEIKDRKILCARSKGKDIFYVPGGKREEGENDEAALSREIREELGVELEPSSFEFKGQFDAQAHGKPEGVMVSVRCYSASFQGLPTAESEIEELAWLSYKDLEKLSEAGKLIFESLKKSDLID